MSDKTPTDFQNENEEPVTYSGDEAYESIMSTLQPLIDTQNIRLVLDVPGTRCDDVSQQFCVDVANLPNLPKRLKKQEEIESLPLNGVIAVCVAYREEIKTRHSKAEPWLPLHAFALKYLKERQDTPNSLRNEIAAALAAADGAVGTQRGAHRKRAVDLSCTLAKTLGMNGTKVEIYTAARKDRQEFQKWQRGELPTGSAADRAIKPVLLNPKPATRS